MKKANRTSSVNRPKDVINLMPIAMSENALQPSKLETNVNGIESRSRAVETALLIARLRNSIWAFGIPSWLLGIADRGIATLADGYLSPIEIFQLVTASLFFLSWLFLKPEETLTEANKLPTYHPDSHSSLWENPFEVTQRRMQELQDFHLIRQEYILPFPFLCQIYHLLNLKHLEEVHSFSLNNLKIVNVSDFQTTSTGGVLRFQTMLDSPLNALRIWRQPIVEVELILHTPYTVELSIPAYDGKRIIVMFNVVPLDNEEHQFLIDIYSDLGWFKPLLQVILHIASCLTLFEDLPYLRALTERNLDRVVKLNRVSNHETMQLFKRFVDLYGHSITSSPVVGLLTGNGSQHSANYSPAE